MAFGVFIERCEHDGKDDFNVVADEVAKVFIVPEIEGTLCNLGGDLVKYTEDCLTLSLLGSGGSQQTSPAD
jgi:hypothetical protein